MSARRHSRRNAVLTTAMLALTSGAALAADPIVGAWLGSIQPADCVSGDPFPVPAARGMLLYHHGGSLTNTDTNIAGRTPGFGTWWRDGAGYQTRFTFIRVAGGQAVGTTLVARSVALGADGRSSQGFAIVHLYDMDGNLQAGPFCSRDSGVRLP
jgi:hypothetical protein